uniref:Uncharacterized protein n=1 Tax=Burkholderia cenocepacia TaxID=95486 RepID=A0A071M5U9_9BURK
MDNGLFRVALRHATHTPKRRIRLDTAFTQFLGKTLTPSLKILMAGIQAMAVRTTYLYAQMHMRMRFVIVRGENVCPAVTELNCREISCRIAHCFPIRSRWHRQQDVESLAALAGLGDAPPAELPGLHEIAHRILAFNTVTVLILQFDPPVTRDIAQMSAYRSHALRTRRLVGDLDHDFRGAPQRAGDLRAHASGSVANAHM